MKPELESLKQSILEGCDKALSLSRLIINRAHRALITAERDFWANDATEDDYSKLYARLQQHQSVMEGEQLADDPTTVAAKSAAVSMRERASRAALQRGVCPCYWVAQNISKDIDQLPLLIE